MNIQAIDTRHGTANQHSFSNGNCLPYTGVPFGMNFYAPQTTDQKGSWWFHPEDRTFQGYRVTHQPSPWMGDFSHLLMTLSVVHCRNFLYSMPKVLIVQKKAFFLLSKLI